jgi:hypothetical protein
MIGEAIVNMAYSEATNDDINHLVDDATYEANERLKAAAPELLEALQDCVKAFGEIDKNTKWKKTEPEGWLKMMDIQKKARAAIAKAEGGE